jgi:membrane fusion protein (multidrug efflux system)
MAAMMSRPYFGLIFLAAPLLAPVSGCQRRGQPASTPAAEAPISVQTTDVAEKPMPRFLVLTGSLTPNESSDVAANGSGAVLLTQVERGQLVEKGDVLARLDARTAVLSTAEADAQVGSAKAQLELAQTECDRVDKLFKANAISGVDYDKQHGACTAAIWTAKAAEARAAISRKGLSDATVRSPFAGMIAERYVSAGEYVQPSSKVARVVSIDPLRLEINVPEQQVALIKQGQAVDFKVSAFEKDSFKGNIRYIGPSLRAGTRDLLVEAVVPNADKRLRPGMFATARVELGDKPAPVIPTSAIRSDGTLKRAYFVVGDSIEERLVKLGEERDGLVEVETGAKAGEKVVTKPGQDVHDGAKVK